MSPGSLYTPDDLRELADAKPGPLRPHLLDEMRKALRWSANVIEAADEALRATEVKEDGIA